MSAIKRSTDSPCISSSSKIQNESLTTRTISGFMWVFTGIGGESILKTAVTMVLARLLSPADFGVVGAAAVVIGFLQIISQLGISSAIVQKHDLRPAHIHVGFTLSIIQCIFIGSVIYFSAPAIAWFFRIEELRLIIRVMSLLFPITGLAFVSGGLIRREMRFKLLATVDFLSYFIGYGVIGTSMAFAGYGVWALVSAQFGQSICRTVFLLSIKRKAIGFALKKTEMKQLLNYGTGHSIARIANYIATQGDNFVVGRLMGAEALGFYGRAYQFLMIPAHLIGDVADKVLFPAMSRIQQDRSKLSMAYIRSISLIAMVTMPLTGFLILMAPEIIRILLGPQWDAVVLPFQILAASTVFRTSYKMSDSLARASGAVHRRAWRQCVYAAAIIAGAWIGHFGGLAGVATGVAAAVTLNFLLMLSLSLSITGSSWKSIIFVHMHYLVIACITILPVWLINEFSAIGRFGEIAKLSTSCSIILLSWVLIHLIYRPAIREEGKWIISVIMAYLNKFNISILKQKA